MALTKAHAEIATQSSIHAAYPPHATKWSLLFRMTATSLRDPRPRTVVCLDASPVCLNTPTPNARRTERAPNL